MSKKLVIGLSASVLLIVLVIVLVSVLGPSANPPSINLPSPSPSTEPGSDVNLLDVDKDVVQELISTIDRPTAYSHGFNLKTYWSGGESTAYVKAWQKGDALKLEQEDSYRTKSILISDGSISIWYNDSPRIFSADLEDYDFEDLDLFARLLTYEKAIDIPKEDILDAGYVTHLDEGCIFIEYKTSETTKHRLYISVEKGVLIAAEVYENDMLTYSLESLYIDLKTPADDLFVLPR